MYVIDIRKLSESPSAAEYSFAASEASSPGILRIDKISGTVTLVRPISGGQIGGSELGEWREPARYFERAARRVELAWKAGLLPDALTWAS
jgi:hypothetical protein